MAKAAAVFRPEAASSSRVLKVQNTSHCGAVDIQARDLACLPTKLPARGRWQPSSSEPSTSGASFRSAGSHKLPSRRSCHRSQKLSQCHHLGLNSLRHLTAAPGKAKFSGIDQPRNVTLAAINIDRWRHLEESLRRQLEVEAQEEEDDGTCPVDCVQGVRNLAEFQKVLDTAEDNDDLVVVDFYNAACGACKYILPQFVKMCKSGGRGAGGMGGVVFVKHDVRDEYDELTDLAKFYCIRMVPMFAFFQDGSRKEQFPTRNRQRVEATIKALLNRRQVFKQNYEHLDSPEGLNLEDGNPTNAALEAEVLPPEAQEGTLRSQLLARGFDLPYTRALNHILDSRPSDLEKVIQANNDLDDQLTATQGENPALVSEVQRLEQREAQLMGEKLRKESDITHSCTEMASLEGRVEDLQGGIAAHDDLTEKVTGSHLVNAEVEAQVDHLGEEGSSLRRKLLLQDFDLTNTKALKQILNEKVEDLERVIANHDDMDAKLRASRSENAQLESKVAQLVENEGVLQTKLVRKDFDLQHYHALKSILDDKVAGLEKALANLDEAALIRDEKLRAALADASASSAQAEHLKEETSGLKLKLLNSDFDLVHATAGKRILSDRVQDLERVLAHYDEVALARDASLAEALSSIDDLEAEVARLEQERGVLQVRNIRTDFDLAHAKATRTILGNKVVDLETQREELSSTLTEAITTKGELEGKVGQLSTGLQKVLKEERSLRGNQAELKRQLFNLQLDNQALERRTQRRAQMLQEKLAALEGALSAAQNEAAALKGVPVKVQEGEAVGSKEPIGEKQKRLGDQLAQIASLTASIQKEEGNRVQIAETDADTAEDKSDNLSGGRPVVSPGAEGGNSGKGLASAIFASLVVLALGGALLLHPSVAVPQNSDSDTSVGVRQSSPVEKLLAVNEFNPVEKLVAGAREWVTPVEQLGGGAEEEEVEQKPVEQVAAVVDTKKAEKGEVERGSVNSVEQVAAVDNSKADSKPEEEVDMDEELALLEEAKGNRPKAEQQQAEDRSVSSEMSSKLFDTDAASGSDKNPYADVPSLFESDGNSPEYSSDFKPDCNVDMC